VKTDLSSDVAGSPVIASVSGSLLRSSALTELSQLVRDQGILASTPGSAVVGRDGVRAAWMLYTYPITLSPDGGALVARCLLPVLRTFASRQLVSIGYTGIPVMTACINHSRGDFVGGCIRDKRKAYGSRRRIEGSLRRDSPVVVVDDSISSGTSLRSAICALEDEGFDVEGAVCLVRFPWRGGVEWARANGYRVETLLDIWRDVGMPVADHACDYRCVHPAWSDRVVEAGTHPAVVARTIAAELLDSGRSPRPPTRFDRSYDARGGVFVSFRDRETEYRVARSGFWHFDSAAANAERDLVLATVKTVTAARRKLLDHGLERLKVAVSFLGPLEQVEPSDLDFDRLGVVVRSRVQPGKVGGALPHTQVFTSDLEQYRHAAYRNARLGRTEPHDLFVHTVTKYVEPGCYWLPYGSSDSRAEILPSTVGRLLTARAAEALQAHLTDAPLTGVPLDDDLVPDPIFGVAVTLYRQGVVGCYVSSDGGLDECLVRATALAAEDARFADRRDGLEADAIAVCVSLLRDRELLGTTNDLARALVKARAGHDTVGVSDGQRCALLLPQVASHFGWSKEQLARRLLGKAQIEATPAAWVAYRTSSWLRRGEQVAPLIQGYPGRESTGLELPDLHHTLTELCGYLVGQVQADGLPAYAYDPVRDRLTAAGTAARVLHAATALANAGAVLERPDFVDIAQRGLRQALDRCRPTEDGLVVALPRHRPSLGADAELLLGLPALPGAGQDPRAQQLWERLRRTLRPDGRIAASERHSSRTDHDFLPGLVLLALSSFPGELPDLAPPLRWYSRRFELLKPWGMVGWHPQAWHQAWRAGWRSDELVAFVREMVDWAIANQHRKSGAFLTDLDLTGPSFHTGFVMEGVADAARLLLEVGDLDTAERYARAWRRGFLLLDRLIIHEPDTFCMREPSKAIGGVRANLVSSTVRVDFVSHAVQSIVKALLYAQAAKRWEVSTDG
jgi:orotate phosphoribosyltransferase